ncbi:B-type cyclin [Microbotryomycetes sp. JL221]|nr:B-type cyclin [Microbotryomycetes sp. JL221]
MSSQQVQAKPARTRRASRAPTKLGDENSTTNTTTRLIGKASSSSLTTTTAAAAAASKLVLSQKSTVSVSTLNQSSAMAGTSKHMTATTTNARRALGDVSNATARVPVANDRALKDNVNVTVKPTTATSRSRSTTSSSSSQTITDHSSKLKIGTTATTGRTSRPASRTSRNTDVVVAPGAPLLKSQEWATGSQPGDEQHYDDVEMLRDNTNNNNVHGLGFHQTNGDDWINQQMLNHREPINYVPSSSPQKLKRNHIDVEDDDIVKDEDDEDFKVGYADGEVDQDVHEGVENKVRIVDPSVIDDMSGSQMTKSTTTTSSHTLDPEDWLSLTTQSNIDSNKQNQFMLEQIQQVFDEPLDFWDTTMVAEYSEEIFEYMSQLEESCMPNPRYMEHQTEIQWPMRTTLIDWLLQVHMRYHMLPETLWIAINIVDRFLSNRVVSLVKFQLVGVTAMFIAAKYEEIMAPSVDEFVYMTEGGYTRDEILKGERIILQSLEFNISPYCSPYSWVRRISKADDYDIQTRTLSKFLMEVSLLDHRFLRAKPSMIAAVGMYLARKMLGGDWTNILWTVYPLNFFLFFKNDSFMYYSNFTEQQLLIPVGFLLEAISEPEFDQKFVYKKYANKKFLKASIFARNWAKQNNLEDQV